MNKEYQSTKAHSTNNDQIEAKTCKQHQQPLQFVCLKSKCRYGALLCAECLPSHRTHSWQTLTTIYKDINALHKEEYFDSDQAEAVEREIKSVLSRFKKRIDRKTTEIEGKITEKIQNIGGSFKSSTFRHNNIDENNIMSVLNTLKMKQKTSTNTVEGLQKFVTESIKAAELKIITILNDIQLSIDVNWLTTSPQQRKSSLQSLKKHIDEPFQAIQVNISQSNALTTVLGFDRTLKNPGILLSNDGATATYQSNSSKGPVVILNSKVTHLAKFTFEIVKLTNTVFFFPDSTIFIGVCQPLPTKAAGLRRLNQSGKNAYLIGSTGWSYHHKIAKFDRKNIVGWKFAEGDKITIEVSFDDSGEIKFTKTGFFFDSEFRMPLELSQNQLTTLQPCIGFEADVGAVVKVIAPPTQ